MREVDKQSGDADGVTTRPYDPSPRWLRLALLATFVVALGFRVWGIKFGLPYDFTPDEIHEILRALKLGAGEFNSDNVTKGGLYLLLFVEYGALFAYWWVIGKVHGATDFAIAYLHDPTAFYLLGRLTVALMGAMTCLVIFEIGRRTHGWRVGLAAAVVGATAHYHGLWSHYVNVDIGMTLAMWCSLLAYMEFERQRRTRWLVTSGALAGIAIAFKLPGALVLLPLLLAAATPWKSRLSLGQLATGILVTGLTALVLSPGLVHLLGVIPDFFSQLGGASSPGAELGPKSDIQEAIYDITLFRVGSYYNILRNETYLLLSIAAVLGAAVACYRRHRWAVIWTIMVAAFLGVMYAADRPGNERYILPVMPAFWLLAASGIADVARQRGKAIAIGVAIVIVAPLYALVQTDYTFTRPDTRVMAKQWIEQNVPTGSKILMDGMRYRFIQSPPLMPNDSTVERSVAHAEVEGADLSRGVSQRQIELYAKAMKNVSGPRYDIHSTVWGLEVEDLAYYPSACFDLIVTSSSVSNKFLTVAEQQKYPRSAAFYRDLPTDPRFEVVYSAAPEPWKIQGPTITVYKVHHTCR